MRRNSAEPDRPLAENLPPFTLQAIDGAVAVVGVRVPAFSIGRAMEFNVNSKSARPSDIPRSQQVTIRQQDEVIELMKGALAAAGVALAPAHAGWMSRLARQERALVGILFARSPRCGPREAILELLPSRDHALERQLQLVDILVHKLRKKLGKDAVVTERSEGFRLGKVLYQTL